VETRLPLRIDEDPTSRFAPIPINSEQLLIICCTTPRTPAADRRRRDDRMEARRRSSSCGSTDEGPADERVEPFVPFFTTKPGDPGIGLVLSRQIAEQPWRIADTREPPRSARLAARYLRLPLCTARAAERRRARLSVRA